MENLPPPEIEKLILNRNASGYEENLRKIEAGLQDCQPANKKKTYVESPTR